MLSTRDTALDHALPRQRSKPLRRLFVDRSLIDGKVNIIEFACYLANGEQRWVCQLIWSNVPQRSHNAQNRLDFKSALSGELTQRCQYIPIMLDGLNEPKL